MNPSQPIISCEVCGSTSLAAVLDLGAHPMCDDLVAVGDTRTCREYPIEILFCATCVTAHQRFQVPKQELFPKSYHYRSRFTADVLNGMRALVASSEERLGPLSGKTVLDIGCNDGSLLGFFRERGCRTIGVEPTGAYADAMGKGHHLYNAFFGDDVAQRIVAEHGQPDIVTFTNVFAHIEDLPALLAALKRLMSATSSIVIENHYLGAVLDKYQFDTFYHEHPRTYSLTSFLHIAKSLGAHLSGVEFPSRYGGNIRVFITAGRGSAAMPPQVVEVLEREATYARRLQELGAHVDRWKRDMGARIAELARTHGRLPAKAFPGRAAILIKLLGVDQDVIGPVYEKPGSMKVGHYVPGTRIPIASDDDLFARQPMPPVIVNLAWHISREIEGYLRQHGYTGRVVDILDPSDFAGPA